MTEDVLLAIQGATGSPRRSWVSNTAALQAAIASSGETANSRPLTPAPTSSNWPASSDPLSEPNRHRNDNPDAGRDDVVERQRRKEAKVLEFTANQDHLVLVEHLRQQTLQDVIGARVELGHLEHRPTARG